MAMKIKVLVLITFLAASLRFYHLASAPPSLYWDEVSLGYNAYSILKTARDEHGKFMPFTNFGAFGDYKPPGYIYADVPAVAIFGLNEFAIRFPSALFGVFTVLLTYFLARKLFRDEKIAQMATFFIAISPWHLQFSRVAYESNMALFFSTLGIYLFIKFANDNKFYIFPSLMSFLIAMYTFTGQRLFAPFIILVLSFLFRDKIFKNLKTAIAATLLFLLLFYPLFTFATRTTEGKLRFKEVTIFNDLAPIDKSIEYRKADNFSLLSNIIDNRRLFFTHDYLMHYLDAFDPAFLFSKGDVNPRLSTQFTGELYFFELPLLLLGIYFLIKKREKYSLLVFSWLLISPFGPATARETPHALRMAHILPTFQLINAYGILNLQITAKFKKLVTSLIGLVVLISIFYYLHFYYIDYPIAYSGAWQFGYKEAIETIEPIYQNYDQVFITDYQGRAYVYTLFYLKVDPNDYYKNANVTRDQFLFYNVQSYKNFIFTDDYSKYNLKNSLFISMPGNLPVNAAKIKTINDLSGHTVFDIGFIK